MSWFKTPLNPLCFCFCLSAYVNGYGFSFFFYNFAETYIVCWFYKPEYINGYGGPLHLTNNLLKKVLF